MYKKILNKLSKLDKNQILTVIAVLAVLVTGALISNKSFPSSVLSFLKPGMSADAIAKKSIDYLNENLLQKQGQTAILESVSKESGLVKIKLKIGSNTYDSYATFDGKLLFPEAFTIDEEAKTPATAQNTQNTQNSKGEITSANVSKVAKTSLETYIVSDCPFGLQAQRAMAEAVKNVPSLADYVKVRYIGSVASSGKTITAMHGSLEAEENLRQIVIREEQPNKYWSYVACYMQEATTKSPNGMPHGDSETCLKTAGVDVAKLNDGMQDPSRGVAYAKKDFDLANKVGAQGSPTFALNGQEISEGSFGGRSAAGILSMVCNSSTNPSDFCKTKLNTTAAATSFSTTYSKDTSGVTPSKATAIADAPACAPAIQ